MRDIVYDNYFWQDDLVRLRPWQEGDWEWLYSTGFDSSLGRLAGYKVDYPPTVSAALEYSKDVENFAKKDENAVFAIENMEGVHVGRIIFGVESDRHGTFGVGIRIAPEHQGKGYGTSAMNIVLRYAFMERRLHKCGCTIIEGNVGSIKMHLKLGYLQEGVLKENIFMNGRYYDEICFGLTLDRYLETRSLK